jgi:uncharacterized glyoxalase superfamily protein PhnB
MLRVPDVRATVEWYRALGFTVVETWQEADTEGGEVTWAELSFGRGAVMFTAGGRASGAELRDVDLYVYVEDIAEVARHLGGRVEVVEPLHETFYGMREVIVRDLNGFSVTFGEPATPRAPGAAD